MITTIAGTGTAGYNGDGIKATTAKLSSPICVALDGSGNVYISDTENRRVRKVTKSSGMITTIAGTGIAGTGIPGYNYDYVLATIANLNMPNSLAVDKAEAGNVYIADFYDCRIQKVSAISRKITTIAGTGKLGYIGDNIPAYTAQLWFPFSIDLDGLGNIYFADTYNNRIRKVTVRTGVITTIAGTGSPVFNGDGIAAKTANLNQTRAIAIDGSGHIYIADTRNLRFRLLTTTNKCVPYGISHHCTKYKAYNIS